MKKIWCVALGLLFFIAACSACGESGGLTGAKTKPGITPLKKAEARAENPENEVTVGGIRYTLQGTAYAAEIVEFSEIMTVQAYVSGVPVESLAAFASEVVRKLYLPDTLKSLDMTAYFSEGNDLWIPQSVSARYGLGLTDCPVYFAGKKPAEGMEFVYSAPDLKAFPYGVSTRVIEVVGRTDGGLETMLVATTETIGLGGIYKASCLRFLRDDGTAEKEIPFANKKSQIDNASGKLAGENFQRYRTEVTEEELPQGTWYYLGKNGKKIRFTLDAIDYSKQQIISLYRDE